MNDSVMDLSMFVNLAITYIFVLLCLSSFVQEVFAGRI